ncbi:MAG: DUF2088 domain-containing protein [Gemmatimonadota bacterium]|nr:MAG: DUF2088 domain-containing protein [Gemmatimonadota bacterium]
MNRWPADHQSLELPWRAWQGAPETERFGFPPGWDVERLEMSGWGAEAEPDLDGLREAVRRLVAPGASVSIAVDDPTRPAALEAVLAAVETGLLEGGIDPAAIDLVMALGAHRAPRPDEVRAKVGGAIADRYRVRLHDMQGELATSSLMLGEIPLRIDPPFLAADIRIGVGTIIPNPFAGFSGGGKIVLPGLAAREALEWLHKLGMMGFGGVAKLHGNRIRMEVDRVARELPLHLSVNCLVDTSRRIREIYYGDPLESHQRGCQRARSAYATPMSGRFDVLICNAYPKDGEFLQAENGYSPLRTGGAQFLAGEGSAVLMAACHQGRGHHGLFDEGMPLHRVPRGPKRYLGNRALHVFAPGISENDCHVTHWSGYPHYRDWDELIHALLNRHGDGARVGIFPAGSCQLGPQESA